jgi:segregation and condensation protein B
VEKNELLKAIEGLVFATGHDGVSVKQLAEVLQLDEKQVFSALRELQERYGDESRGMQIIRVADMYLMTTKPELAPYLEKFHQPSQSSTLSQAALETLAIIAYRQPITRADIEEIRGVKSEKPLQTLTSRGLIQEVGRRDAIGRPILYGTTKRFLEQFGLNRLEDLPPLEELQQKT